MIDVTSQSAEVEEALQRFRQEIISHGGVIAVALGRHIELSPQWAKEPRVHAIETADLTRDGIHQAVPSNTRVVIMTDGIPAPIFKPIHTEIQKRRLTYIVRHTGAELDAELRRWLPRAEVVVPPPDPPPPPPPNDYDELSARLGQAFELAPLALTDDRDMSFGDELLATSQADPVTVETAAPERSTMAKRPQEKGSLVKFVKAHVKLSKEMIVSDEGRRLFALANREGLTTTLNSVTQAVYVLRKQKEDGTATKRAAPEPEDMKPARTGVKPATLAGVGAVTLSTNGSLSDAVNVAILALKAIAKQATDMDKAHAALLKERHTLKAKVDALGEAFKQLT